MARANDAAYWPQRMKLMEDALKDHSFSYVENMERQFMAAQAEVERQIAVWYQRFAANNQISLADAKRLLTSGELAEFRWTVGEYIAYGQQNALDGAWMKQLENASARVHISRLEAIKLQIQQQAERLYANQLDLVDAAARDLYLGSYYGTAFELQRGLGVGWTMQAINEATIAKVLSRPWTADNLTFRDRCWTNKQALVNSVNTQLTQMIIRGEAPDKAIAAISHQFKVGRDKAGRLIMTEAAAFSSAAQKDCYGELGVERYKIVASFDTDICELCGAMDGEIFKMADYQVGLTAPPFHPWCRCCTCPYYADMTGLGERWTRNPDGTTSKVPADMSFEEWKERFVRTGQSVGGEGSPKPGEITQIGRVDFSDKDAVFTQLKRAETDFTGLDYEMNCTITTDGKVWRISGTSGEVNSWGIVARGSNLKGSYSYHNHPAARTWFSFSAADVRFFLAAGEECAIASDDTYRYIIHRTKNTVDIDPEVAYHRFDEILRSDVSVLAWNGLIDFERDGYHETMKRLCQELRIDYARRKIDGT